MAGDVSECSDIAILALFRISVRLSVHCETLLFSIHDESGDTAGPDIYLVRRNAERAAFDSSSRALCSFPIRNKILSFSSFRLIAFIARGL